MIKNNPEALEALFEVYKLTGGDTDGARTAAEFFGPLAFPSPLQLVLDAVADLIADADRDAEFYEARIRELQAGPVDAR